MTPRLSSSPSKANVTYSVNGLQVCEVTGNQRPRKTEFDSLTSSPDVLLDTRKPLLLP